MGQRASNTTPVTFQEVRVPAENLLGGEEEGFKKAMAALDVTRPIIASGAVGLARSAMELAISYASRRIQFGVPIAQHGAVQTMLADMAISVSAARLMVWRAAWLADKGLKNTREAAEAKAFFGGRGHESHYRCCSDLRRNGVHQVASGGKAHEGCQGDPDL